MLEEIIILKLIMEDCLSIMIFSDLGLMDLSMKLVVSQIRRVWRDV